ncbi:MAG: hypothetical protein M1832_002601 [Thelocarpon impressellum]|nr:MAG: hypothetical protein M1832_002601 [Thelocarpon impressellum]
MLNLRNSLAKLASSLLAQGPQKNEVTSRRVRALFNGAFVFDTTAAHHVWEHPYFPQYYVPLESLVKDNAKIERGKDVGDGGAYLATLDVGGKRTDRVVVFEKGALKGLARFEFAALEAWFEEDQEIYGHPKDPYKRIDILSSSRRVRLSLEGVTIAESSNVAVLLETGLPTRYYLPQTSMNWALADPSASTSLCPYKGVAEYFSVIINGTTHRDLIWWYRYPTAESAGIAGRICGYNEKLDVELDGVLQERPKKSRPTGNGSLGDNPAATQAPRLEALQFAWCATDEEILYRSNRVRRDNAPEDPRGCGRDLLDNLRGQCGWIEAWECSATIDGYREERSSFRTPITARRNCVKDAIYLASGRARVETECRNTVFQGLYRWY